MNLRLVLAAVYAVTAFCSAEVAHGQLQRQFPKNALRGSLQIDEPPRVTLNGRPAQLAPGARIRNQANALALSGTLIGTKLLVHYTLDPMDLVSDVWILTPQEAAKRPWPATAQQAEAWTFDPVAQTWSRP
jgi:hypothetical protein